MMTPSEANSALVWIAALNAEVTSAIKDGGDFVQRPEDQMLILTADGETKWGHDWRWAELRSTEKVVRAQIKVD
jgi:hypothetical protein